MITIFWFRRDLRLFDNTALQNALQNGLPVLPIFIFDTNILAELKKTDCRLPFIHHHIEKINKELSQFQSGIRTFFTTPLLAFETLIKEYKIHAVYTNDDYEPYAVQRDDSIAKLLSQHNIQFKKFKDHLIFEKSEVVKDDGKPYTVFTPYSRKWKALLVKSPIAAAPLSGTNFLQEKHVVHSLENLGFEKTIIQYPPESANNALISHYSETRNIPSIQGTSRLGIHLRFGTISIRQMVLQAMQLSETYLNELIWREFYQMIIWHFPHVVTNAFKPAYDNIKWLNHKDNFEKWCKGETGYPIVDAGMRELNESGFMHNRVRMITASFLCKHLLIDWRWGEAYFAEKLLDFELASNNGGWQWCAGSGCDAAPYFRIFNPYLQTKKFDPELKYIKKWVPEYADFTYPTPMVDHEFARKRCLEIYGSALQK